MEQLREKLAFAEKNPAIFEQKPVLDKGFVRLVDWLGGDDRIVQAARVSYGKGTKTKREDAALIDYLVRHRHTSPLEQVVFTFHIKLPLFVFGQLVRHRTASLNAKSARYSIMEDEFYIPENFRTQDSYNKQGSGPDIVEEDGLVNTLEDLCKTAHSHYEGFLRAGVSREQARMILPQNLYTEVYWTQNLHNLLHLLKLRLDKHAQWEIREYAKVIYHIVREVVPNVISSWENHALNSVSLSAKEVEVLRNSNFFDLLKESGAIPPSIIRERLEEIHGP